MVLEGARTQSSCAGTTRKCDGEHPNVAGATTWDSRRVRGWSTTKEGAHMSRVRQVWLGHECQGSERVRSKQESLGRDDIRRHGESRPEYAGDWISVVAREKSQVSEWNRIVCRGDGVRFAWCEKLQVLFGSECSKGDRQAPRCVTLVRESEHGTDLHSFDCSVRDEPNEPRCVLLLLLQGYRVFRTMLGRLAKTAIRFVLTFGAEQIEDLTITIANSVFLRRLKRARQ